MNQNPFVQMTVSEKVQELLQKQAADRGLSVDDYLQQLLAEKHEPVEETAYEAMVRRFRDRTPEQIEADREELLRTAKPARPVPEGKTWLDMVVGTWPGDESDEEIERALRELS